MMMTLEKKLPFCLFLLSVLLLPHYSSKVNVLEHRIEDFVLVLKLVMRKLLSVVVAEKV